MHTSVHFSSLLCIHLSLRKGINPPVLRLGYNQLLFLNFAFLNPSGLFVLFSSLSGHRQQSHSQCSCDDDSMQKMFQQSKMMKMICSNDTSVLQYELTVFPVNRKWKTDLKSVDPPLHSCVWRDGADNPSVAYPCLCLVIPAGPEGRLGEVVRGLSAWQQDKQWWKMDAAAEKGGAAATRAWKDHAGL